MVDESKDNDNDVKRNAKKEEFVAIFQIHKIREG